MSFDSLIEKVSKWNKEIPEGYITESEHITNMLNNMFCNTPLPDKECWITVGIGTINDTEYLLRLMKKYGKFVGKLFPRVRNDSMGNIIIEWTLSDGRVLEMISRFCPELKTTEWELKTEGFYKEYIAMHIKRWIIEDLYKILAENPSGLHKHLERSRYNKHLPKDFDYEF